MDSTESKAPDNGYTDWLMEQMAEAIRHLMQDVGSERIGGLVNGGNVLDLYEEYKRFRGLTNDQA